MSDFREVKRGFLFGAGAYVGWVLVKWGVMIAIVSVSTCAICTFSLTHMDKTEKAITKVEKALDYNIISPKRGLKVGDELAYRSNCAVRSKPSRKSKRVGTAKARMVFKVKDRKGKWRMISLPDGTIGWAGCGDRL